MTERHIMPKYHTVNVSIPASITVTIPDDIRCGPPTEEQILEKPFYYEDGRYDFSGELILEGLKHAFTEALRDALLEYVIKTHGEENDYAQADYLLKRCHIIPHLGGEDTEDA